MYSDFYEILCFVSARSSVSRVCIWERFSLPDYLQTDDALNVLVSRGYLRCKHGTSRYYDTLTVTVLGREQLAAADNKRNQSAKRERDQQSAEAKRFLERHDDRADAERRYRTQNKLAILMPLLSFLLGLLAEYFFQIIALFIS